MKKSTFIKIALCGVLVLPLVVAYCYGLTDHCNLASLKANKEYLDTFVREHYSLAVFYYICTYIMVGALSFPFASLITITGGFLFGTLFGALYTNIGATIGGVIAFLAYRYLFGSWVREHYGHRLVAFNQEFERNGAWYLVMIRLIAVIPFFVANAFASVVPISVETFIWTTSLGIIPSALVYSFAGEQLDSINSVRDIFSGNILIAFVLLALLTVVSILVRSFCVKNIE